MPCAQHSASTSQSRGVFSPLPKHMAQDPGPGTGAGIPRQCQRPPLLLHGGRPCVSAGGRCRRWHATPTAVCAAGDANDGLMALLTYFDVTYISGTARRVQHPTSDQGIPPPVIRHLPPLFPPPVWNVFEPTVNGDDRTNNLCEAWNRGFRVVVGQQHPSLWCAFDAFQQDAAAASTTIIARQAFHRAAAEAAPHHLLQSS